MNTKITAPQDQVLIRIQNWYQTNCNGNWEHSYGISIQTIDNPGWNIKIDLSETSLENLEFSTKIDNGSVDWMIISAKDKVFEAFCDPGKLTTVLGVFLDEIIPNYTNNAFLYRVYIPLIGGTTKLWRPVQAKMVTEEVLEIVHIPDLKYEEITAGAIDDIPLSKAEMLTYRSIHSIGDRIKTSLTQMYNGVTLIVRENK